MYKKQGFLPRLLLRIYLILFSAVVILPMIWTAYTSLKTNQEFFKDPWALPAVPHFQNYVTAWDTAKIGTYFVNSVLVTVVVVLVVALLGAMTAYATTRLRLRVGNALNSFYMVGMFIPTVLCVVPMFLQLQRINLLDNLFGLVLLYIAVSMPFTVFVMAGFFRTLQRELEEAAFMDGCGYLRIFFNILLPLVRPGLATVSIFNFLGVWNEYVLAKTLIFTMEKNTLPLGLVQLMQAARYKADWGSLFAGLTIIMIPTVVIYVIFQNQITSGLTVGAVKG
jgi:N-acetylglucosamine transport system permease protein